MREHLRASLVTALFPAAAQAELAARELSTLGAKPQPIEEQLRNGSRLTETSGVGSTLVSYGIAASCLVALALATTIFPGVGYAVALAAQLRLCEFIQRKLSIGCWFATKRLLRAGLSWWWTPTVCPFLKPSVFCSTTAQSTYTNTGARCVQP